MKLITRHSLGMAFVPLGLISGMFGLTPLVTLAFPQGRHLWPLPDMFLAIGICAAVSFMLLCLGLFYQPKPETVK